MNLPETVKVELAPQLALGLVRWFALTSGYVQGVARADAEAGTNVIAEALSRWMISPELPLAGKPAGNGAQAELPVVKRGRGRPSNASKAAEKKPDVFDVARHETHKGPILAGRVDGCALCAAERAAIEEHPATKGAAAAIVDGPGAA